MECLSAEEHLIHGFCHQSVWEEAQQGYQCDENVMDSTGCGLSEDDVFSLGLLDPPQPGRGGEEGELMESLADHQLSRSGAEAMLEQEQGSCNLGFAAEGQLAEGARSTSCRMHTQHLSSLREQLCHFQYPPLTSEMCGHLPFFGSNPSVFMPVFYSQPLKVASEEPAVLRSSPMLRKLDLEALTSTGSYEAAKPSASLASADSACGEACVPDMSPRSHLPSPKAEACVPDYFSPAAAAGATGARQLRRRSGSGSGSGTALALAEECGWPSNSSDTDNAAPHAHARHPGGGDAPLQAPPTGCDGSVKYSRSDCLQRYRDKKLRRHFTHKVRYTARKLNADRRPRVKGRFVKASEMPCADMEGGE